MCTYSSLQHHKSLKTLSTFGIGGEARYYIKVSSLQDMQKAIIFAKKEKIPYWILGKGSNSLFDDRGFCGIIIHNAISFYEHKEDCFYVGAGYSFSLLGAQTARKGFSGLEFASGIPGSVGGAVFMNAGASGKETADHLQSVTYVNEAGEVINFKKEALAFSYRSSPFQRMTGAIVAATFCLKKDETAKELQKEIIKYRYATQPYGTKNVGCIFRNPKKASAGTLIEKCNLKSCIVGDAEVSSLHANFIINKGGARAKEVVTLIEKVQKEVKAQTGETLESEVCIVAYDPRVGGKE